jgi:Cu/Ag efflux protein CusF
MANAVYPKFKEALIDGASNVDLNDATVKAVLIDTNDVTYNAAHDFYDDVSAGAVGTPQTIANTTVTNGLFDGDNVTFTALSGDPCEAILIFIDTGTPATSRLVAWLDTGVTGLPVTPNSGDVTITWNASGIIQF